MSRAAHGLAGQILVADDCIPLVETFTDVNLRTGSSTSSSSSAGGCGGDFHVTSNKGKKTRGCSTRVGLYADEVDGELFAELFPALPVTTQLPKAKSESNTRGGGDARDAAKATATRFIIKSSSNNVSGGSSGGASKGSNRSAGSVDGKRRSSVVSPWEKKQQQNLGKTPSAASSVAIATANKPLSSVCFARVVAPPPPPLSAAAQFWLEEEEAAKVARTAARGSSNSSCGGVRGGKKMPWGGGAMVPSGDHIGNASNATKKRHQQW